MMWLLFDIDKSQDCLGEKNLNYVIYWYVINITASTILHYEWKVQV